MGQIDLETSVQYVKGAGPVRARQLAELGIETVEDLLLYFPRRFDLRRQVQPISSLGGDEQTVTIAGEVQQVNYRPYGKRPFFECSIDDATGVVTARWFHGGYLRNQISPNTFMGHSSILKWRA